MLADPQPFISCFTNGTSNHAPVDCAEQIEPQMQINKTTDLAGPQNMWFALNGLRTDLSRKLRSTVIRSSEFRGYAPRGKLSPKSSGSDNTVNLIKAQTELLPETI